MGKNWYSDIVPENIELHSPLMIQIQAASPMSRKLIYSISQGNELEEFSVEFNTGESKHKKQTKSPNRNVSLTREIIYSRKVEKQQEQGKFFFGIFNV